MSDPILPTSVLEAIRSVAEVAREANVTALELENGDLKVQLKRHRTVVSPPPVATEAAPAEPAAPIIPVTSELVGRFLLPKPSVRRGDSVAAGDIVAYIESMTLMNEVRAPVAGRIVEILVEPGHPVEYGQVLLALLPEVS